MRWRRSERRPKWFKAVRRLEEAENKRAPKISRLGNSKVRGSQNRYMYKKLKIDGKAASEWKEPKPLLDVFNGKDDVVVVAELKGFKRENIKISIEKQQLTLSARAQGNHRYYKRLNLPEVVIPETMHVTYKNGVLEVRLKKAVEENAVSKLAG
jgi:HSP20 family molecular chaperone IbpA